jgi:hypothetical protein
VDRAAEQQGVINHVLMSLGVDRHAAAAALQRLRGLSRHRLLVPAVHDPAAVREPRAARPRTCSMPRRTWAQGAGRLSST